MGVLIYFRIRHQPMLPTLATLSEKKTPVGLKWRSSVWMITFVIGLGKPLTTVLIILGKDCRA